MKFFGMTFDDFRSQLTSQLGVSFGGKRDLYKVLGYPKRITLDQLYNQYQRGDIANRIITAYPQATWREAPIFKDEEGETPETSEFSQSVLDFYNEHNVLHYLERVDRLSGIGEFAILVLGFNDGNNLSDPLPAGNYDLMYMQPYMQLNVQITKFVDDQNDARFGLPELYTITPSDNSNIGGVSGTSVNKTAPSQVVHHSRVIHVSEFLDDNDVFGIPRLMPIYNRLEDLQKVIGGSAEIFWLNGRAGIKMVSSDDASMTAEDEKAMAKQVENYQNQITRMLAGQGLDIDVLNLPVTDPSPNVNSLLDLISGATAIPKRILTGSERGDLASSQDENNFGQRVLERRETFATPTVVKPFTDKMIATGNIIPPQGEEYFVLWPENNLLGPAQQAEINQKRTDSLTKYSNTVGAELIVPPSEFREKFLGLDPEFDGELLDTDNLDEDDEEVQRQFDERDSDQPVDTGDEEIPEVQNKIFGSYKKTTVKKIKAVAK